MVNELDTIYFANSVYFLVYISNYLKLNSKSFRIFITWANSYTHSHENIKIVYQIRKKVSFMTHIYFGFPVSPLSSRKSHYITAYTPFTSPDHSSHSKVFVL